MVIWHSGSALVSISEVNLRQAWLVLGWVTMSGSVPGAGLSRYVTSHPGQLNLMGRRSEYQPKGDDALLLGRKSRYGTCVGGR